MEFWYSFLKEARMILEFPNATSRDYFELVIPEGLRSLFESINHKPHLLRCTAKEFPPELKLALGVYNGKITDTS